MSQDPQIADEVEALVREWLTAAASYPANPAARRLADALADPDGLRFVSGFIDRVIRPEDVGVAAASLRDLTRSMPGFLPWHLRLALRAGALASAVAPGAVIPVVRVVLRRMVGHLLVDATPARLGSAIARIRGRGVSLNLNLLGEAVLGAGEAQRRLDGAQALLSRPDVDYVSIKVSATVPPHSTWAFSEAVEEITTALLPLFGYAAEQSAAGTPKFINLDMEEYRDLDLTLAVFTDLLDRPELEHLEAGVVLQAYLPDALAALMRLQSWAARRRARGGASIKTRLVKGANLPVEQVDAELHDWPAVTWPSKQQTDTNYKRLLHYALTPERVANVRIGVAGHNLFDVAYAWILAGRRGVRDRVEFEMLLGMAEGQAEVVRATVGGLLLYVPVVHPHEFEVAVAYLVRRLEEGASQQNFMSAVFALDTDAALFDRERSRFLASLDALEAAPDLVPVPRRQQDRRTEDPGAVVRVDFTNVADTDPSLPGNRAWAQSIRSRIAGSSVGSDLVAEHTVVDADALDLIIHEAATAGRHWGAQSGAERAAVLRRAAAMLQARRADLLEVMAAETGKTLDQGDPEVSEAIDFAGYYSGLAEELDRVDGAVASPVSLTVVAPPWNFPVAIPAGSTLAALAAGSAVIVKPATQSPRSGSMMVQALWDAGVPREVLRLVHVDEAELGRRLVSHPSVERLILTGGFETAELFRSFRPDLPLLAETSGKNAIVVTPHADLDLAVKDLVASAFGHAGQKCSAASLGILVGSVASSRRFRAQLVDAVSSLRIGYPDDPHSQVGPLIEPAAGKLIRALTELGPGEEWWIEPRRLDDTGRLWSPGLRAGVRAGSEFHLTEYFGPVLGLMAASSLPEAIALQNQVAYGLTAGLHTLDRGEVEHWLAAVEAGNVYLNRGTTGAIVRRQPFGGWKRSAVGAGAKAGGPNYLIGLSDWSAAPAQDVGRPGPAVRRVLDAARDLGVDVALPERGAGSDARALETIFAASDVSALAAERNILRYQPVPVTIRCDGGSPAEVARVLAAAVAVGAPVVLSSPHLVDELAVLADAAEATYLAQDDEVWAALLQGPHPPSRVRLIGSDRVAFAAASAGRVDIALYPGPVLEAGRIELLTLLREQAVSLTAHRFGSPTSLVTSLPGLDRPRASEHGETARPFLLPAVGSTDPERG